MLAKGVPMAEFTNPYKPGAGHMPPYLAGRDDEIREFEKLLQQDVILNNLVLTGLRGVGKTVLLDTFKPIGVREKWFWVGADLSESTSLTEQRLVVRLITDLAVVTSNVPIRQDITKSIGFVPDIKVHNDFLDFNALAAVYESIPGLIADKLKGLLEFVWEVLKHDGRKGIIFAYDEAQNMSDHAETDEYPLSLLLDVFQSIQKRSIPFMLVLTGLPTLFPKLVDARTFAERMFRVIFLSQLDDDECREAILKPIEQEDCPIRFDEKSIKLITQESGGYPYFVQFICREVFDVWIQQLDENKEPSVPMSAITRKLDTDFFSGRWSRATDRQRELLQVIAALDNCHDEFAVQEVVEKSKEMLEKSFSSSHVNQMLLSLANAGLIYKNRYAKYSFAVPLLGGFIRRQMTQEETASS